MKRLHVSLAVADLDASVEFYTSFFDAPPSVLKSDYAKWMLEDPRVNFAISTRGSRKGVDHLGVQVDDNDDLDALHTRLKKMDAPLIEQGKTVCCYARSEKNWIIDPEGVAWETFLTTGHSPVYGADIQISGPDTGRPAPIGRSVRDEACCAASPAACSGSGDDPQSTA